MKKIIFSIALLLFFALLVVLSNCLFNRNKRSISLPIDSLRFQSPSFEELTPTARRPGEKTVPTKEERLKIKLRPTDQFYKDLKENDYKVKDTLKTIDPKAPPVKVQVEIRF